MRFLTPGRMILFGLFLMITGVVLPLLMVIKVLESTFFLNFFSYASSLIGMVLGIIGTVSYSRRSRQKRNQ
ncbi:MAG: hypothetical protein FP831_03945 [Anaerolineae bacterium]|nr:hypothetical protein [Anaerolineae bacterium]